jgi:hypothetical protein
MSAPRRSGPLATLVACLVACLPAVVTAPATFPHPTPPSAPSASSEIQPLPGTTPPPNPWVRGSALSVRATDLDADGDLDLVALGATGIHTWLNAGGGRFVEQNAANPIVRGGLTVWLEGRRPTLHQGDVAVSTERTATTPRAVAAIVATRHHAPPEPVRLPAASRPTTTGGSRAPPASRA